jgi:hypothetical protein
MFMTTKQAPADGSLKLKSVNEGAVLRIRDHSFRVVAAEQHDGLVHPTLEAPDGGNLHLYRHPGNPGASGPAHGQGTGPAAGLNTAGHRDGQWRPNTFQQAFLCVQQRDTTASAGAGDGLKTDGGRTGFPACDILGVKRIACIGSVKET